MNSYQLNLIIKKWDELPKSKITNNSNNLEKETTDNYIVYYLHGQLRNKNIFLSQIKKLLKKKQIKGLWGVCKKNRAKPNTRTYYKTDDWEFLRWKNKITREKCFDLTRKIEF